MTRLVEVKRIQIPLDRPFTYPAARAEVQDAIARGDEVTTDGDAIVIRSRVDLRRGQNAA
jgi:hypothetical protein